MSLVLPDWYYSCPDFVDWSDPINWDHPTNEGLVMLYLAVPDILGFGSNDLWRDATHRYPGTLTGFTAGGSHWGGPRGRNGGFGSLLTNGTSEYVTVPSNSDIALGDVAFTLEGWVNTNSVTGSVPIFGKWDWGADVQNSYLIWRNGAAINFSVSATGSSTISTATIASALSIGSWVFVEGYHDPAANVIGVAVNGGTETTTAHSTGVNAGTHAFEIGRSNSAYFSGYLDGIALTKGLRRMGIFEESIRGYPNTLNRIPFGALVQQAAAPGGGPFPWFIDSLSGGFHTHGLGAI